VARKFLGAESPFGGWVSQDSAIEFAIQDQRPVALFGQGQGLDDLRSVATTALAALPPLGRRERNTTAPRTVRLRPSPTP
jgi:hypothetical protein